MPAENILKYNYDSKPIYIFTQEKMINNKNIEAEVELASLYLIQIIFRPIGHHLPK